MITQQSTVSIDETGNSKLSLMILTIFFSELELGGQRLGLWLVYRVRVRVRSIGGQVSTIESTATGLHYILTTVKLIRSTHERTHSTCKDAQAYAKVVGITINPPPR